MRISYLLPVLVCVGASTALAHLGYPASRYFSNDPAHLTLNDPYLLDTPSTRTITGQTTKAFGWAAGTDDDFARQDDQRYLRFTLDAPMTITISITATDPAHFLPAFSLYAGLGHGLATPSFLDYDGAAITQQYLQSLGGTQPKAGAFDALHTWKIANDPATSFADLATLTYVGHAADGTSANFGLAAGINGDGVTDGFVTGTFSLAAGEYTLVVGGANYFLQGSNSSLPNYDNTNYAFTAVVSNVPEPSAAGLLAAGVAALGLLRQRVSGPRRALRP
jgi:hypothetical protein